MCGRLTLLVCAVLLAMNLVYFKASGGEKSVVFDVSAYCEPNFQIDGPSSMIVSYMFVSNLSFGAELSAVANVDGVNYEPSWSGTGVPSKGWLSLIFPGPLVEGELFCQNEGKPRYLQFSYISNSDMELFLSLDGAPSKLELEHYSQFGTKNARSRLQIYPNADMNFSAGNGTSSNYWLQVAIPISSTGVSESLIFYGFF